MLCKVVARSAFRHSKVLHFFDIDFNHEPHTSTNSSVRSWKASLLKRPWLASTIRTKQTGGRMPPEVPKIVFVLGGPGAGKGTQCQRIVDRFQFVHLSAGDLLREERLRQGSEYGELIESYIRDGRIVPVEVTCSLLEKAMKKSGRDKFLIDGFPRNQDNLEGWKRQMTGKADLQFVLFFNCDENVCVERCLNRGKEGSGRSDDNMESLKKRITTYNNDSLPIIEHFQQLGQVKKIDASQNVDKVFDAVEKVFCESGFP